MPHPLTPPLACLLLATLVGCGEMKPRPAADSVSTTPPPAPTKPTADPNSPQHGHNSASTLGKARDAAVRGKEKADAYQQEVGRQADEVFKDK